MPSQSLVNKSLISIILITVLSGCVTYEIPKEFIEPEQSAWIDIKTNGFDKTSKLFSNREILVSFYSNEYGCPKQINSGVYGDGYHESIIVQKRLDRNTRSASTFISADSIVYILVSEIDTGASTEWGIAFHPTVDAKYLLEIDLFFATLKGLFDKQTYNQDKETVKLFRQDQDSRKKFNSPNLFLFDSFRCEPELMKKIEEFNKENGFKCLLCDSHS